jgi:hypothetical protein
MQPEVIATNTEREFVSQFKYQCDNLNIPRDLIDLFLLCLKHAIDAKNWNISVSFKEGKLKNPYCVLELRRSVTGEWSDRIIVPSQGRYTIMVKPGTPITIFDTSLKAA